MDNQDVSPERDDEALADAEPPGEEVLDRLISDEMGEKIAQVMRAARRAQEAWYRARNPDEGLRERKRRVTRQLISDAATTMFATRGFDNVKVSEVAERVGVSEKTIYNYFITKDTERFDQAPEELVDFIPLFLGMIDSTPALRAAWLEMHDRLANVACEE